MIDPGPDVDDHVRALASRVANANRVSILVTHGHADHAASADTLAEWTGAEVFGPGFRPLAHGDPVETDEGTLLAVHTPGHMREHICFHWPARRSLFAGDLVLGVGDTTWVAEYAGCVADYLASLERVEKLDLAVIYPAHGPPLTDPAEALARFRAHRVQRIEQVRDALLTEPDADVERLLDLVYGAALPDSVRGAALLSLSALVDYVNEVDHGAGG